MFDLDQTWEAIQQPRSKGSLLFAALFQGTEEERPWERSWPFKCNVERGG